MSDVHDFRDVDGGGVSEASEVSRRSRRDGLTAPPFPWPSRPLQSRRGLAATRLNAPMNVIDEVERLSGDWRPDVVWTRPGLATDKAKSTD